MGENAAYPSLNKLYSNYPPHASTHPHLIENVPSRPNEIRWARNNCPHNLINTSSLVATCLPIKLYIQYGYLRDQLKISLLSTHYFYQADLSSHGFRDQSRPEQSDHFLFPPHAKLPGKPHDKPFSKESCIVQSAYVHLHHHDMNIMISACSRRRLSAVQLLQWCCETPEFRRTPPPVAGPSAPLQKRLDSPHDTLGQVVHTANRQVSYTHCCSHMGTADL